MERSKGQQSSRDELPICSDQMPTYTMRPVEAASSLDERASTDARRAISQTNIEAPKSVSPITDVVISDNLDPRAKSPSPISNAQRRANSPIRNDASNSDKTIGEGDQIAVNNSLLIDSSNGGGHRSTAEQTTPERPIPRFKLNITRPNFLSKRQDKDTDSDVIGSAAIVPTASDTSKAGCEQSKSGNQKDKPSLPTLPQLRRSEKRDYKALSRGHLSLDHLHLARAEKADDPPANFKEALERPDAQLWVDAAKAEMASMMQNGIFELVSPPDDNIVGSRWVFTWKRMSDGSTKREARLVAKGYSQKFGIDFNSTYAPVAEITNIRLLFAIMARYKLTLTQIDIKTAFLYGYLEEDIYMSQPEGFHDGSNKVWHLKRSLYGLKQAPRAWN